MFGLNFRRLSSAYKPGNKERVGIDLAGNNLKLVHIRVSPIKSEVVKILHQNISGLNDDNISELLETFFVQLKLKSLEIVSVIPSHLVITKNIEVPSTDHREIREIINLQAGRHTPYSREEIIVDCIEIGTYKHNYTKILLVIVARSAIKRQIDILNKAGLRSEKVFLSPEGIAWSISNILKLATEELPVAVAHIDEGLTDFSIVFKNKVIFIRSVPIGTQHLATERERYQIRFGEEIKRSLEAYHSEDIEKNPHMLVLTGAVEELKYLGSVLESILNLPVKVMPYFNSLVASDEASKTASTATRLSFLNVIAPLLAWSQLQVNLVPEEIKLKKIVEERGRNLIKTGILILILFVLLFSVFVSKVYFKTAYLNKLNKKYETLNQEVQELQKDFNKSAQIKNYLANRGYSLEVLAELYSIIPADLELNDIRFDEQGKFTIRGVAESMSIVFSFVENMEKSKYFKEVRTKYTTKRKEVSGDVTDFEIGCLLKKKVD